MRIKKVNGKKIWSFVLAMAMVIGILPQITMPVQAAGGEVYAVLRSDNKVYETNSDNTKTDGAVIADKYTITNLFVADGVTEIGSSAFQNCTVLKSITIPASVTSIRDAAFKDCIALTSVSIPKVTTIDFDAFNGCITLANLTVGATPPTVGEASFYLCPLDRTLTIVGGTAAVIALYDSYYYSTIDGLWIGWTLPAPIVSYDLWVGGVQVTSANASNITGDGITGGKVSYVPGTPGAYGTPGTPGTLTLTNANITGYYTGTIYGQPYFAGIYGNSDLKIALVSENTIDISTTSATGGSYGIWIESGKLELSGIDRGSDSLTVKSGAVTGENSSSAGIFGVMTINNSTVTATGGAATGANSGSCGISDAFTITGSTVTATGGAARHSTGINSNALSPLTITDSTVTATGSIAGLSGEMIINGNSTVTATGGFAGISGPMTITDNSTVTASGGYGIVAGSLTITGNSTVTATGNTSALMYAYYGSVSATASTNVNGDGAVPYISANNNNYKWFQTGSGGTPPPVPKTYTVTYNANGGSGSISPQTTNVGIATTLTTNTFQRTGYTFAGWNTLANGKGTSYANSLPPQTAGTTVTLYAQWTEITYEVTGTVTDDKDVVVSGATVMLMKGNKQTGETATTGSDGKFAIVNVPNGTYNLVVSKGDITVTTIIVISSADKATGTIKLPSGKTNSIVDVKPNTPQIVVGGLDKQFSTTATDNEKGVTQEDKDVITALGSVEIKLTAKGETNTAPNANDITAKASSNGKTVGQFIDLSVLKTVTTTDAAVTTTNLKELQDLVEIFIPLDTALQGKSDYVVYRYHGDAVNAITTVANADGEMIALVDNNTTIKLTVKKFSTYAIAYKNTPTGGGGTGGGSTGGTTGGEPEKPEIEKPIPPVVKPIPPIVKPLPPKKPAKNPQTGNNTPLEFPITFATMGLALMALGLYLKGKRKQQSAE